MNPVGWGYAGYYYTYGAITYTASGTCTDDSGIAQTGVTIDIYRIDGNTEELVQSVTSSTGGVFTYNWIDNTDQIFAVGRYTDTLVGRSNNITPQLGVLDMSMRDPSAAGNFNIVLSKPSTRRIFIIS